MNDAATKHGPFIFASLLLGRGVGPDRARVLPRHVPLKRGCVFAGFQISVKCAFCGTFQVGCGVQGKSSWRH